MALAHVKITGGPELLKQLQSVHGVGASSDIAKQALMRASVPIMNDAFNAAPIRTGHLASTIKRRWEPGTRDEEIGAVVVLAGEGLQKGRVYAPFVEFGHRVGRRAKNIDIGVRRRKRLSIYQRNYKKWLNDQRRKIEAKPFLGPAYEANAQSSIDIILAETNRLLTKKLTAGGKAP